MQEAFLPCRQPVLAGLPRGGCKAFNCPGSSRASAVSCAGPLQIGDAANLIGGEQPEHVRQRAGSHSGRPPAGAAPSVPRRRRRAPRRWPGAAGCAAAHRPACLPPARSWRHSRSSARCAAGQSLARSRIVARASSAAALSSVASTASARALSPRRASAAATSRVRRSASSAGRSAATDASSAAMRSCQVALAQPQRCQPRAETGPRDAVVAACHQFLQHRRRRASADRALPAGRPVSPARQSPSGPARQQVGVLLHQRHQFQRRKRVRRVVAQQPGEHVGEFAMDRGLVVREQRLAVAQQGKRGAPRAGARLELGQTCAQRALVAIAAPGVQQTFQPFGGLLRVDRARGEPAAPRRAAAARACNDRSRDCASRS